MDSGNKRILGYSYADNQDLVHPEHVPEEYEASNELDWITEHNMPHGQANHKTVNIKRTDQEYKDAYKLFYNIQETGNYCNHSLKSAWKAMIKVQNFETAEKIEKEMIKVEAQWSYILKMIAPMRWNMSMWTRFNIAESSVRVIQDHWKDDYARVNDFLDEFATEGVLQRVGWTQAEFDTKRKEIFTDVVQNWISETDKWINSCHDDEHDDRIVKDGDDICRYNDIRIMIYSGEKQSKAIFEDLLTPILKEINEDDRDAQTLLMKKATVSTGVSKIGDSKEEYHSFNCEHIFLRTRVRYFELLPSWEMERVADDTQSFWDHLVNFRASLVDHPDRRGDAALYTQEEFDKHEAAKDDIIDFFNTWADHTKVKAEKWDSDEQLYRRFIRKSLKELEDKSEAIYNWHYNMVMGELQFKEGAPREYNWRNFVNHSTRKISTDEYYNARDMFRKGVFNEIEKYSHHLHRRI